MDVCVLIPMFWDACVRVTFLHRLGRSRAKDGKGQEKEIRSGMLVLGGYALRMNKQITDIDVGKFSPRRYHLYSQCQEASSYHLEPLPFSTLDMRGPFSLHVLSESLSGPALKRFALTWV